MEPMHALMVQLSDKAAVREEGTLARRYTGGPTTDVFLTEVDLLLGVAAAPPPPPPPDFSALALAFAASFAAFLASFFSSFLDGPFFSSASLIFIVVALCVLSGRPSLLFAVCVVYLLSTWLEQHVLVRWASKWVMSHTELRRERLD